MMLTRAEPGADASAVPTRIGLSGGRTLTVRTITHADVRGLDGLFDGLSKEDRYLRFFSFWHPSREFLERMTREEEDGGYRVVAVVSGTDDTIVAEAGYALLPDGNGEFALTVAAGWRGWLGPYLLDCLVSAAAARGVPNLQADILVENSRMLALVAKRGCVVLSLRGTVVRVAIDAARSRPGGRPL